jgi:flagellar protein FlbD
MICLSRLNGQVFALNPDLIERVDATPDTVITMVDGVKYVVSDPMTEVIDKIVDFRAAVVARSHAVATSEPVAPVPALHVVPMAEED